MVGGVVLARSMLQLDDLWNSDVLLNGMMYGLRNLYLLVLPRWLRFLLAFLALRLEQVLLIESLIALYSAFLLLQDHLQDLLDHLHLHLRNFQT